MKILFCDIETAPHRVYAWGLWDQNIAINQIEEAGYTLSWAAKWLGEKEVMFRSIREPLFFEGIWDLLDEADVVVHFNGKKFDIPTLNQEFIRHGLLPPAPYKQVDLFHVVKQKLRLPSNKLDYVLRYFGLKEKYHHKGMDLWRGCMAGDEKAWAEMEEYNKQDVRIMEPLYNKLLPWIPAHPNHNIYGDMKGPVCTNCGSAHLHKRGTSKTSTMLYQRFQCQDCGTWMRSRLNVAEKEKRANILVQDKG